jgi:hypothetical protein
MSRVASSRTALKRFSLLAEVIVDVPPIFLPRALRDGAVVTAGKASFRRQLPRGLNHGCLVSVFRDR